jgi:ribosome recycling factor
MPQPEAKEYKVRMDKAIEHLKATFQGVRTGRAHPALVEEIKVDYYGAATPIKQMGGITIPEPRQILITPYDRGTLKAIEKAIQASPLGINPRTDGDSVRLTLPELTRERRVELSKLVNKYAEEGRVAVRNVRREAVDAFKKREKDGDIGEDDLKKIQKEVQDLTDEAIRKIEGLLQEKEKEILND